MSDEYLPIDPDTVVLEYIAGSVHSDPAFKRRAEAAWAQVAGERDAAVAAYDEAIAEYAALAAAHDAAMAEAQRYMTYWRGAAAAEIEHCDAQARERAAAIARADAAVAQLAAARADGARRFGAHLDVATGGLLAIDALLDEWQAAQGTGAPPADTGETLTP